MTVVRKNLTIFLIIMIAVLCICTAFCACKGDKKNIEADAGSGGSVVDKDKWNVYDGLAVGFVNAENCPDGIISEYAAERELNVKLNERYYMVADFTVQAPFDNDGRGSVTAEFEISPADSASATMQETNTGNVTEETADGVTTIKAIYRIPAEASVKRKIRAVIRIKATGRDLGNISLKLNCPPDMPSVSASEFKKEVTFGCAERLSKAEYYDGEAIRCQVISVSDETDRIVIPNTVDGRLVKRVVSFGMSKAYYIAVPSSVTRLDKRAFVNCVNLKSFHIHGGIEELGEELFSGCDSLESVTVDASNEKYFSRDGVLYDGENMHTLFAPLSVMGEVTVPDGVTAIEGRAFEGRAKLTRINLPDGVTALGEYAFSFCTSLSVVRLPASLVEIGEGAFYGCTGLTEIIFCGSAEEWEEVKKHENWTDCKLTVRFGGE